MKRDTDSTPTARELLRYRVVSAVKALTLVGWKRSAAISAVAAQPLREERSRPIMERFRSWLEEQHHPPRSAMGKAVNYALNNWDAHTAFLDNARIPLDNNASERALRVAALGRKNYLFVGHEAGGENLAGLYSLVATCEAHGENAQAYLADVLLRVQTHPQSRIHELLPKTWLELYGQQKTGEEQ